MSDAVAQLHAALAGRYAVEREVGAGGMAIVYLARDLRHDRRVALKVLRPELSAILGGERFLAEIRTTANLQHPHILPLHDSGEANGIVYYVMPFVEGESLRDRLRREKHRPVDDAVRIAREVASALDYAHRHGVIHRDIKPENILLHDGQALVADFGIALAASRSDGGARLTETGLSLGTPQYMAPEQAMGERDISSRADIYALGCVLYECLVGEAPFLGPTPQAIIARLLTEPPRALTAQRNTIPPNVEAATLRALQKLPADRFTTAAQFAEALSTPTFGVSGAASTTTSARPRARAWRWIPIIATLAASVALTSLVWWRIDASHRVSPVVARFTFAIPNDQTPASTLSHFLAISPDGSQIVYVASNRLYRRSLAALDAQAIPGSDAGGASNPVVSPDGQSVAYYSAGDGTIKRIAITGGVPVVIATTYAAGFFGGMSWSGDFIIWAAPGMIVRVPAAGGRADTIAVLKATENAEGPQLLPDGKTLIYTLATSGEPDRWEKAQLVAQTIHSSDRKVLLQPATDAWYVPTGQIVYGIGGSLFAVPFDVNRLVVKGGPVPVVEGVARDAAGATGVVHFAFSPSGSLVFTPGPATGPLTTRRDIALTDRQGNVQRLNLPPGFYDYPRVSPDGKRIAIGSADGKDAAIWVYDLDGKSAIRRLTLSGKDRYPVWSGDGLWIAFQSDRDGTPSIYRQRADGSGTVERLTTADAGTSHVPDSWSPRNDGFLYSVAKGLDVRLWWYSLADKKSAPFDDVSNAKGTMTTASFSPDGRWVAYTSSAAIEHAVFVQPMPPTGAKYQVSQAGENGHHPQWSRDGKELFYIPQVGGFVSRSISTQSGVTFGNPAPVPRSFPVAAPATPRTFDVLPDGKIVSVTAINPQGGGDKLAIQVANPRQVNVVLNWFEELKRRAPAR
ncbi:MAG TPA: protein kinase [Gemmatimonadaceae bacterium]